jgi:outer membrane protein
MGSVYAEGLQKIGFINTDRIYQESNEMYAIAKRLEKEFGADKAKLDAMQKDGVALQGKLSDKKLTDAQRAQLEEEFKQLNLKFLTAESRLMEDYNLRRNEEFAALQQQANDVITKLAKDQGYDLILQDVIYVNGKFDITDQVIKMLNKK